MLAYCAAPPSTRPMPLPQKLEPTALETPLEIGLHVRGIHAEGQERVEIITVAQLLEAAYEDVDGVAERSHALDQAVQHAHHRHLASAQGDVFLLARPVTSAHMPLRDVPEWLGLQRRMSTVEHAATQSARGATTLAFLRRARAQLVALQLLVAYHELLLDFAALTEAHAHHRLMDRAAQRRCTEPLTSIETACVQARLFERLQAIDVAIWRVRWRQRSRTLSRLLGRDEAMLFAPPSTLSMQPKVASVGAATLLSASREADPSLQAMEAEDGDAFVDVMLAWWSLTGIKVHAIDLLYREREPVPDAQPPAQRAITTMRQLVGDIATLLAITLSLERHYYIEAWRKVQAARSRHAVTELHVEMRAEELEALLARRLEDVHGSREAVAYLLAQAHADTRARQQRCVDDPTCPLSEAQALQRAQGQWRMAVVSAILHYNLSQFELLATLGYL